MSTTKKLKILDDYPSKKLKTFILQDGTNNILKVNKSAGDMFSEFNELVTKCKDIFETDVSVLCEVPPLKNRIANRDKVKLIDELNELLLVKTDNDSSGFQELKLNQIIHNTPKSKEMCKTTLSLSTIRCIRITPVVYQCLKIFFLVFFLETQLV